MVRRVISLRLSYLFLKTLVATSFSSQSIHHLVRRASTGTMQTCRGHYWAGIAFDQSGNLYASDVSSGEIYKLPPDRSTLILFASGLNAPAGLAVDAAGNLYEADTGSGNIYKFTPQGVLSTFASGLNLIQGTGAYGNDNTIVFDSHGNLFVASNYNDTYPSTGSIYKISPQGAVITFADLPDGYLGGAIGFDSAGNLFILTGNGYVYNYRLLKYTPDGTEFTVFGAGDLYYDCGISGTGLVIDNADNIYIGTVPDYINEYLPRTRAGIRFRAYTSGVASLMRFLDNSSFSQR